MEKITVKVPDYVKKWYADNKFKLPMAQYAAMILIDYAFENGAKESQDETKKKVTYNEYGELVEH